MVTSTPLCTVKGCPAPKDPDWHIPWCQDIPGHECFGGATHQHVPKRSQGGKKIVACLCAGAHDRIDNGTDWGNAVVPKEDGTLAFWAFDLHGKTLIERALPKEVMPSEPEQRVRSQLGQRVEEGEEAGRLSDGAEGGEREAVLGGHQTYRAQAARAPVAPSSAPSLKEESDERMGDVASGDVRVGIASEGSVAAPATLTHEQRVAIAQEIRDAEWNRQWIAGDTGNAWIAELGEEAEQYLCDFGYAHESLANILRVCAAIPPPYRNGILRYSLHVVVYKENREDMEMWLD